MREEVFVFVLAVAIANAVRVPTSWNDDDPRTVTNIEDDGQQSRPNHLNIPYGYTDNSAGSNKYGSIPPKKYKVTEEKKNYDPKIKSGSYKNLHDGYLKQQNGLKHYKKYPIVSYDNQYIHEYIPKLPNYLENYKQYLYVNKNRNPNNYNGKQNVPSTQFQKFHIPTSEKQTQLREDINLRKFPSTIEKISSEINANNKFRKQENEGPNLQQDLKFNNKHFDSVAQTPQDYRGWSQYINEDQQFNLAKDNEFKFFQNTAQQDSPWLPKIIPNHDVFAKIAANSKSVNPKHERQIAFDEFPRHFLEKQTIWTPSNVHSNPQYKNREQINIDENSKLSNNHPITSVKNDYDSRKKISEENITQYRIIHPNHAKEDTEDDLKEETIQDKSLYPKYSKEGQYHDGTEEERDSYPKHTKEEHNSKNPKEEHKFKQSREEQEEEDREKNIKHRFKHIKDTKEEKSEDEREDENTHQLSKNGKDEEHYKSTNSDIKEEQYEEEQIPTRPNYPGKGVWAIPGKKHQPYIRKPKEPIYVSGDDESKISPEGKSFFEEQSQNFDRQSDSFPESFENFKNENNFSNLQNKATAVSGFSGNFKVEDVFRNTNDKNSELNKRENQARYKPVINSNKYTHKEDEKDQFSAAQLNTENINKNIEENKESDDEHEDVKDEDEDDSEEDHFVPTRLYTQVRKYETEQHLPESVVEPRLREVIKDSKVHIVYNEEGYEDSGYDHAGHEKNAENSEAYQEGNPKLLSPDSEDASSIYIEEKQSKPNNLKDEVFNGNFASTAVYSKKEMKKNETSPTEYAIATNMKIKLNPKTKPNIRYEKKILNDGQIHVDDDTGHSIMSDITKHFNTAEREKHSDNINSFIRDQIELKPNTKRTKKRRKRSHLQNLNYNQNSKHAYANILATENQELSKPLTVKIRKKRFTNDFPKIEVDTSFLKLTQFEEAEQEKEDRYPYYNASPKKLNRNSALRYAQDLKIVPVKKGGELTFYKQADKIPCAEVQDSVNPIPKRIENASEDGVEEGDDKEVKRPRLSGLGDKIDCFKLKYFGDEPLDSPFFAEDRVNQPEPIFGELLPKNKKLKDVSIDPNIYSDVDYLKSFEKKNRKQESLEIDSLNKKHDQQIKNGDFEINQRKEIKSDNYSNKDQKLIPASILPENVEVDETIEVKQHDYQNNFNDHLENQNNESDNIENFGGKLEETQKLRDGVPSMKEQNIKVILDLKPIDGIQNAEQKLNTGLDSDQFKNSNAKQRKGPILRSDDRNFNYGIKSNINLRKKQQPNIGLDYLNKNQNPIIGLDNESMKNLNANQKEELKPNVGWRLAHLSFDLTEKQVSENLQRAKEFLKSHAQKNANTNTKNNGFDEIAEESRVEYRKTDLKISELEKQNATENNERDLNASSDLDINTFSTKDTDTNKYADIKKERKSGKIHQISTHELKENGNSSNSSNGLYDNGESDMKHSSERKLVNENEGNTYNGDDDDDDEINTQDSYLRAAIETKENSSYENLPSLSDVKLPNLAELDVDPDYVNDQTLASSTNYEDPFKDISTDNERQARMLNFSSAEDRLDNSTDLNYEDYEYEQDIDAELPPVPTIKEDNNNSSMNSLPESQALKVRIVKRRKRPHMLMRRNRYVHGLNLNLNPPPPSPVTNDLNLKPTTRKRSKPLSEVFYKDDIKPDEQLNVLTDVINNIKNSSRDMIWEKENRTPLKFPNADHNRISFKPSDEIRISFYKTSTTRPERKRKPMVFEPSESESVNEYQYKKVPVYKTRNQVLKNLMKHPNGGKMMMHLNNQPIPVRLKVIPPFKGLDTFINGDQIPMNTYIVPGMKPPLPEKPYIYSDYNLKGVNVRRELNTRGRRKRSIKGLGVKIFDQHARKKRNIANQVFAKSKEAYKYENNRFKRSSSRPGYSPISRQGMVHKEKEEAEEEDDDDDDDDYVPHRPMNFHYDPETRRIVYHNKPSTTTSAPEYIEVEYDDVEEATHPPKKVTSPRTIFHKDVLNPENGPTLVDFVAKLRSDPSYQSIPDPEPTKVPSTTTTVSPGKTTPPEFLKFLETLHKSEGYVIIEDETDKPKKAMTTTTEAVVVEEVEEEEEALPANIQNSPGGQFNANNPLQIFDITEFLPKTKNYSPRTSIDYSKYKTIERPTSKPKVEDDEIEEEIGSNRRNYSEQETKSTEISRKTLDRSSADVEDDNKTDTMLKYKSINRNKGRPVEDEDDDVEDIVSATTSTTTTTEKIEETTRLRVRGRKRPTTRRPVATRPSTTTTESAAEESIQVYTPATHRPPSRVYPRRQRPKIRLRTTTPTIENDEDEEAVRKTRRTLQKLNETEMKVPPNHKEVYTPIVVEDKIEADTEIIETQKQPRLVTPDIIRYNRTELTEPGKINPRKLDVEVFKQYNTRQRHGGNYIRENDKRRRSRTTTTTTTTTTSATPVSEGKDNKEFDYEEKDEVKILFDTDVKEDDDTSENKKKVVIIKDPSKRLYFYAPVK